MGVTPHINMDRVARYVSHLAPEAAAASADDDIVIVSAIRTAICRARKGGFRDTQPDALLSAVLKETVARAPNAPIGDIVVGNVLQGGAGALTSRMAQLCAGISEDVPCHAINRQCSSGLQAVATVAGQIKMGVYDFGIAAGVESMSKGNMMDAAPKEMNPEIFECEAAQDCIWALPPRMWPTSSASPASSRTSWPLTHTTRPRQHRQTDGSRRKSSQSTLSRLTRRTTRLRSQSQRMMASARA